jgi:hypothetical protein
MNLKKRGNYKICPKEMKVEAIKLAKKTSSKEASEILGIPEKNIKRWIKNGPERKKGAGRKTMDPEMEESLLKWIEKIMYDNDGIFPESKDIKLKAKEFSSNPTFKASKGWCDKFIKRNSMLFDHFKKKDKNSLFNKSSFKDNKRNDNRNLWAASKFIYVENENKKNVLDLNHPESPKKTESHMNKFKKKNFMKTSSSINLEEFVQFYSNSSKSEINLTSSHNFSKKHSITKTGTDTNLGKEKDVEMIEPGSSSNHPSKKRSLAEIKKVSSSSSSTLKMNAKNFPTSV